MQCKPTPEKKLQSHRQIREFLPSVFESLAATLLVLSTQNAAQSWISSSMDGVCAAGSAM
jgi:hypothetical protein